MDDVDPYQVPDANLVALRPDALGARTRIALAFLYATLAVSVFGTFIWILQRFGVIAPASSSEPRSKLESVAMSFNDCVSSLILFGAHIAFMAWLHRAVQRGWFLDRSSKYSPAFSVGVWFIPLANLVWPYYVLRELWRSSCILEGSRSDVTPRFLRVWWSLWAAYLLALTMISAQIFWPTLSSWMLAAELLTWIAYLVCIFMAIHFIRIVQRAQREHLGSE